MEKYILTTILPHINHWGYFVLLLMTFLETAVFLGLVVPGESVVVIAGLLASRGVLELGDVIWVASLGAIMGDTVGYLIGRRFGELFFLKYGKYLLFKKEYLIEAKGFFDKHGGKTVFFGRFTAWLRAFAPFIAGTSRMHYLTFLFFNIAGGIAWATTFSLLGYIAGNSWDIIRRYSGQVGVFSFTLGVIMVFLYFFLTKKRRLLKEKIGWVDKRLSAQMPKTWYFMKARFNAGSWYGLNLTIGIVLLLLALFSFGEIIEALMDKETLFYLDFKVQGLVEELTSPQVTKFMVDITNVGGVYLVLLVSVALTLYLLYRRYWWDLFTFFLLVAGGETTLTILKLLFQRPRPTSQLVAVQGYSFPSGHAFTAMILYGFLAYIVRKLTKSEALRFLFSSLSIFSILVVGISRIYLNVHWLTDVLGGYASGFAWLVFSIVMVNTMRQMTATEGNR